MLLLGALDPEMAMVRKILRAVDVSFTMATRDTQLVSAEQAYAADFVPGVKLFVECGFAEPDGAAMMAERADHHNKNDPGFDAGPADFLAGSSIGQVVSWLAKNHRLPQEWPRIISADWLPQAPGALLRVPHWHGLPYGINSWAVRDKTSLVALPDTVVYTAAADHCPAAAYSGSCPGIDQVQMYDFRLRQRAGWLRRSEGDIEVEWEAARDRVSQAPFIALTPDVTVRDLRGISAPSMNEALSQLGQAGLYQMPMPDGTAKLGVIGGGDGTRCGRQVVEAFWAWAKAQGAVKLYGSPARGYGGAFVMRQTLAAK
jgi:hypothetical protein